MGMTVEALIECPSCGNPDATITTYDAGARVDVVKVTCRICDIEVMA